MKFVCLVYAGARPTRDALPADGEATLLLRQDPHPDDTATTVRLRDGRVTLHDGPAATTAPGLVTLLLVEAADRAAALRWASGIDTGHDGGVEVRPVRDLLAE